MRLSIALPVCRLGTAPTNGRALSSFAEFAEDAKSELSEIAFLNQGDRSSLCQWVIFAVSKLPSNLIRVTIAGVSSEFFGIRFPARNAAPINLES